MGVRDSDNRDIAGSGKMTQAEVKYRLSEAMRKYAAYITAYDTAEAYRRQLTCGHSGDAGTHIESKVPDEGFIRLTQYSLDADLARREWLEARDRVQKICSNCEAIQREVLIYRYLNNTRFEDIAARLGYVTGYVFELHRKAIKYLCNILETS